jgi:hypothetical protein
MGERRQGDANNDGLGGMGRLFEAVGTPENVSERWADTLLSLRPGAVPMNQTSPTKVDQRVANLKALHQQLEEMAARTKGAACRDERESPQGPVLVIRGK